MGRKGFTFLPEESRSRLARGGRLICLSVSFLEDDGLLAVRDAAWQSVPHVLPHANLDIA